MLMRTAILSRLSLLKRRFPVLKVMVTLRLIASIPVRLVKTFAWSHLMPVTVDPIPALRAMGRVKPT